MQRMFVQQATSGVGCRPAASHLIGSASCGAQGASEHAAPAVRLCCSVVPHCRSGGGRRRCRNHRLSSSAVNAVGHRSRRPAGGGEPRQAAARCQRALRRVLQARRKVSCMCRCTSLHAVHGRDRRGLGNRSVHRCRTSLIGKDDVLPLEGACGSPCCALRALL